MGKEYLYIFATILFTVYGHLIMKWQVVKAGQLPEAVWDKLLFVGNLFINPWIISGAIATLFSAAAWMLAMTKIELSAAYPFTVLSFVMVMLLSVVLFHESISAAKIIGSLLVIVGILVVSQG
jgi:multidrug transporter EmrE-like cation transporter